MTEQPETDPKVRLMVLRATAVRAAMNEIMNEQRDEIIRRARAKLAAMGVSVADAEGSDGDAKLP